MDSEHRRWLAIGDPQAPIERFLAILKHNGLLGADGRLRRDVGLISMGDHFDWGGRDEREKAARSGLELLSWLADHPPDQVILIVGNHDLGRVGELAEFSDDEFLQAHELAAQAYDKGVTDPELEVALLARFSALPTAELAARDFAAFNTAQRDLVIALLRERRFRVAVAMRGALFCHAGITLDDMAALGLAEHARADEIAAALNDALDRAVDAWTDGPLSVPDLHRPGDSEFGEGRGVFYHRPTNPTTETAPELLQGPYRRRYDARRLPHIVQVIGHINDRKCRKLLGPWAVGEPAADGALRHMVCRDGSVMYRAGLPDAWDGASAMMIFTDGLMNWTEPVDYQLLDLARCPWLDFRPG